MSHRIGVKLFAMIAGLFLLAVGPLFYAVYSTVSYFGNYTVSVNKAQIKQQSLFYLQSLAREQAKKNESFFSRAMLVSALMAAQARDVYDNLDLFAGAPGQSLLMSRNGHNGMLVSSPAEEVVTMYWGGDVPNREVSREMLALSRLDQVLSRGKREVPEGHATHMITVSGIGRYMTFDREAKKSVYHLPPASDFDLRDGEPMTIFSRAGQLADETRLTRLYKDDVINDMMLTATSPVIDSHGTLRAITGVDVPLGKILAAMPGWQSPESEGLVLFSFLLDRSGRIIAFPRQYHDIFGIGIDWTVFRNSDDILGYNIFESARPELRELLPEICSTRSGSGEVVLDGSVYVLTQQQMPALGWHLLLVANESSLVGSVRQTEEALGGTIQQLINKFAFSGLMIFAFAIAAVFLAVRHFVAPLTRLSEAAIRVGKGDLSTRFHLPRKDELGSLADSFNAMVQRLESAERIQKRHAKQLELEVEEQTRGLRKKNFELEDMIARLNAESERRKRAVELLEQSEEQIRTALDASLAGLCIVQGLRFKYINPEFARIFGYPIAEMLGELDPFDLVVPELREAVRKEWLDVIAGRAGRTRAVRCVRRDGTTFEALSGGDPTVWQGQPAVVATIMDISEQKKAEQQLRESAEMLQASLKEKEVLLREIYHRTKNNMLVIISMLHLQANDIDDPLVRGLFQETENRIRAMSLAHEKLYQSQNLSEVDLLVYLGDMVRTLVENMVLGNRIGVRVSGASQVPVSLDTIVPLGLAANEIVTNSIKHAFPGEAPGTISIGVEREADGTMVVELGDNGIGLPPDLNLYSSPSLGLQITVNLIERQLHGSLAVDRRKGTVYTIRFKETNRPKRI